MSHPGFFHWFPRYPLGIRSRIQGFKESFQGFFLAILKRFLPKLIQLYPCWIFSEFPPEILPVIPSFILTWLSFGMYSSSYIISIVSVRIPTGICLAVFFSGISSDSPSGISTGISLEIHPEISSEILSGICTLFYWDFSRDSLKRSSRIFFFFSKISSEIFPEYFSRIKKKCFLRFFQGFLFWGI